MCSSKAELKYSWKSTPTKLGLQRSRPDAKMHEYGHVHYRPHPTLVLVDRPVHVSDGVKTLVSVETKIINRN